MPEHNTKHKPDCYMNTTMTCRPPCTCGADKSAAPAPAPCHLCGGTMVVPANDGNDWQRCVCAGGMKPDTTPPKHVPQQMVCIDMTATTPAPIEDEGSCSECGRDHCACGADKPAQLATEGSDWMPCGGGWKDVEEPENNAESPPAPTADAVREARKYLTTKAVFAPWVAPHINTILAALDKVLVEVARPAREDLKPRGMSGTKHKPDCAINWNGDKTTWVHCTCGVRKCRTAVRPTPTPPSPTDAQVRKARAEAEDAMRRCSDSTQGRLMFALTVDSGRTILTALDKAQGEVERLHGEAEKLFLALGKEQSTSQALRAVRAPRLTGKQREAGCPDDIRALGWAVAVHNDYKLNGVKHTFWLFTKGDRCVKGEGLNDAEALNQVRAAFAAELEEVEG